MADDVVIDANIFKSYYEALINGTATVLTSCPKKIFDNLGVDHDYVGYLDEGGIIKHEWENLVDRQWFDAWFGDMLVLAHLELVTPYRDNGLESKLYSIGFPHGRDMIYVRVSRQVVNQRNRCTFITEDLDFFDPTQKQSSAKTRQKILLSSFGSVNKVLRKHGVDAKCVASI